MKKLTAPLDMLKNHHASLKVLAKSKPTGANEEMYNECDNTMKGLQAFIQKSTEECAEYDMMKPEDVTQL